MADGKKGVLKGILQRIPIMGGGRKQEGGLPDKGPVETYDPSGKVVKYDPAYGWYPHRIKYKGLFDLDGLYKTMALWFKEKRFELHETLYKNKPPELEIRWRAERKRSSYVMEILTIHLLAWGDHNVEAVVKGKKKRLAKVRMVLTIAGDVNMVYPNIFGERRWTANNFERRIASVFKKIMDREIGGSYWDQLYYEVYDLNGRIKEFLQFSAR